MRGTFSREHVWGSDTPSKPPLFVQKPALFWQLVARGEWMTLGVFYTPGCQGQTFSTMGIESYHWEIPFIDRTTMSGPSRCSIPARRDEKSPISWEIGLNKKMWVIIFAPLLCVYSHFMFCDISHYPFSSSIQKNTCLVKLIFSPHLKLWLWGDGNHCGESSPIGIMPSVNVASYQLQKDLFG